MDIRYKATFDGRRCGAIGAFSKAYITFGVQGTPRSLNKSEQHEAAIKAANSFGFEVNHIIEVVELSVTL